jgi:hypothetical protein
LHPFRKKISVKDLFTPPDGFIFAEENCLRWPLLCTILFTGILSRKAQRPERSWLDDGFGRACAGNHPVWCADCGSINPFYSYFTNFPGRVHRMMKKQSRIMKLNKFLFAMDPAACRESASGLHLRVWAPVADPACPAGWPVDKNFGKDSLPNSHSNTDREGYMIWK